MTTASVPADRSCLFPLMFLPAKRAGPLLFALIFLLHPSERIYAQDRDYSIHANIIYRFTKYIDWPSEKKEGDFVIGVTGESPIYNELKIVLAGKSVGSQKIVVKKISSSATSFNCHILFIADENSYNIKKIAARTANMPVLLVSESEGLAEKGSCINFSVVSDHLKLEINKNNIEQRDLNIASELLQLGRIVR